MAKLSIIVPVYNVELYVRECIYSIINQTYRDLEIIIVDDGSTDNSPEIVDNLAQNNKRIRVIHQKNMGLPGARNTGIAAATGEYIGFIDSDDKIKPEMYKCLIMDIEKNNSDLSICNFTRFNKVSNFENERYKNEVILYSPKNVCDYYSLALDSSCNKLYKLEILKKNNIWFEDKSVVPQEDFYFLLKYLANIEKCSTVSESFYEYRIRKSSITNSKQPENLSQGCIRFVDLVGEYHKCNKILRDTKNFELYLLVEMMLAVINTSIPDSSNQIRQILIFFRRHNLYTNAILYYLNKIKSGSQSFRRHYDIVLFSLYKLDFLYIASILELIRLKRLQKNLNTASYYD